MLPSASSSPFNHCGFPGPHTPLHRPKGKVGRFRLDIRKAEPAAGVAHGPLQYTREQAQGTQSSV